MLTLRHEQMELLARTPRDRFLERVAIHLESTFALVHSEPSPPFSAPSGQRLLRDTCDWMLENEFTNARDVAGALEMIFVFKHLCSRQDMRHIIESRSKVQEKLHRLSALSPPPRQ